jgi:hypothetical protein
LFSKSTNKQIQQRKRDCCWVPKDPEEALCTSESTHRSTDNIHKARRPADVDRRYEGEPSPSRKQQVYVEFVMRERFTSHNDIQSISILHAWSCSMIDHGAGCHQHHKHHDENQKDQFGKSRASHKYISVKGSAL